MPARIFFPHLLKTSDCDLDGCYIQGLKWILLEASVPEMKNNQQQQNKFNTFSGRQRQLHGKVSKSINKRSCTKKLNVPLEKKDNYKL